MKGFMKNWWFNYGDTVKTGVCALGIGVLVGCLSDIGRHDGCVTAIKAMLKIGEKTPDLTFGEFRKQVEENTFDISVYQD